MAAFRTAWHPPFAALVTERAPSAFEVLAEVLLALEPQKADLLLLRKRHVPLDEARTLRRLWAVLSDHTLVEFKSISRPPRPGDCVRLWGYAAQYHTQRFDEVGSVTNLSVVMATASLTPTLERDFDRMGLAVESLGGGYYRLDGSSYPFFLALLDEVAESEHDPLLGAFGHRKIGPEDADALAWFVAHVEGARKLKMSDLEGYEDYVEKIRQAASPEVLASLLTPQERVAGLKPEERVAGLKPEERVAGLEPEERLVGLDPNEAVLALPNDVLRRLPKDFVDSLPEAVQKRLRERLGST